MLSPLAENGSYPLRSIVMTYVSGASDRNTKRPPESVCVVATWDGLLTRTSAPATGCPLAAETTVPAKLPVVPAATGPHKVQHTAMKTAIHRRAACARTTIVLLLRSSPNYRSFR